MDDAEQITLFDGAHVVRRKDQPARILLGGEGEASNAPLVECFTLESGRAFVDHRLSQSAQGAALRPDGAWLRQPPSTGDGWLAWEVHQTDPATGLTVTTELRKAPDVAALRVRSTLANQGRTALHLTAVSLLSATLLPEAELGDIDVIHGCSGWMSEGRWSLTPIDDFLADITPDLHGESARDCFRLTAESGWSSSRWEPVGFVQDRTTGKAVAWQIEHNGAWTVELSRRTHALGFAAYGPTDLQHHWLRALEPGDAFTTPWVAVALGDDGWESAAHALTSHRRALRRAARCSVEPAPIVYNDYLNTIMADPTSEKLRPLIAAAADAGVEVFCIDAGWFADEMGADWWNSVGAWQPSTTRFEGGVPGILQEIRDHGLIPGLWIEPLALGLESPAVEGLMPAVMTRSGVPIVEQHRLRLDMRHPLATRHLDEVLDRMVGYGIGYLKIDDNYSVGSGPDANADSPGDGLLEHQRAWAKWLEDLGQRHPDLVIENCGSGGMTRDYALLAHTHLQSTSDLQDMTKYPTIAAAAPATVLLEQIANWGVPTPDMTLGETISTLAVGLSGSCYLGGPLHTLAPEQRHLVREATAFAKGERDALQHRVPSWPLGLPAWTDAWVALAHLPGPSSPNGEGLLFLWHRADASSGQSEIALWRRDHSTAWELGEQLFPVEPHTDVPWDITQDEHTLRVSVPASSITARIFRIRAINHQSGGSAAAQREES